MGTKNNPGQYDCYAKLLPDEPYLTLRAKDPSAPYLTRIWAAVRQGDTAEAERQFNEMLSDSDVDGLVAKDGYKDGYEKLEEARNCASAMFAFRATMIGAGAWARKPSRGESGG